MKGVHGLILAIGLAVVGGVCNLVYLRQQGQSLGNVKFVVVNASGTNPILQAQPFKREDLVEVEIPEKQAEKLKDLAVRFEDVDTVVGMRATRAYTNPELLLVQDLKTPPPEFNLDKSKKERAIWIPVEAKTFVPSMIVPGEDRVSFVIPQSRVVSTPPPSSTAAGPSTAIDGAVPTPTPMPNPRGAGGGLSADADRQVPTGDYEVLGPFDVLAVGNRLGSPEVFKAARTPQVQENVIAIRVTVETDPAGNEKLTGDAHKLWNRLLVTRFREVGVLLLPRERKSK